MMENLTDATSIYHMIPKTRHTVFEYFEGLFSVEMGNVIMHP